MRFSIPVGAAMAALVWLPGRAPAQAVLSEVRAGFPAYGKYAPAGRNYYKAGAWVPLRVTIRAGAGGIAGGQLAVETTDSDDVLNRFPISVPALPADPHGKNPRFLIAYTRPGSLGAEIRVRLTDGQGREQSYTGGLEAEPLDFSKQLYLAVGSRPADLPEALHKLEPDPQRLRIRYAAAVDRVEELPTRWFGYSGVDLLILTTGRADFVEALRQDVGRLQALAGWVQRGGRLLVSISPRHLRNVNALFRSWRPALPPVLTEKVERFPALEGPVQFGEIPPGQPFEARGNAGIAMARLQIRGPGVGPLEILAQEKEEPPLLVRVPYGLGNVTLLAIDLEEESFTRWEGRTRFWQKVIKRLGPGGLVAGGGSPGSRAKGAPENDLATDLQKELETFPDLRPVPFGLVAFLIFLYILLIGPLDYLFLKKVVKRLQWTWITYLPLVALVALLAFLVSSDREDSRLMVNQVSVLDIDQLGPEPRVHGTTWFTLFSPHVRTYNVSLEPAPDWAGARSRVLVTWLGRPEVAGLNSTDRQRSEPLFRTSYEYAGGGRTLAGVPLPFAGTKSFTAGWEAKFPRPFAAHLFYDSGPGVADRVAGSVTNPLPVELQDAVLEYGGKWFVFTGPLLPGKEVRLAKEATALEFDDWAHYRKERPQGQPGSFQVNKLIKNILFHEKLDPRGVRRDHVLRSLDQSWRTYETNNTWEVPVQMAILYGRLPRRTGTLAEVNGAAESPARLVIADVRNGGLTRDVFLRVYLPVVPGKESSP